MAKQETASRWKKVLKRVDKKPKQKGRSKQSRKLLPWEEYFKSKDPKVRRIGQVMKGLHMIEAVHVWRVVPTVWANIKDNFEDYCVEMQETMIRYMAQGSGEYKQFLQHETASEQPWNASLGETDQPTCW